MIKVNHPHDYRDNYLHLRGLVDLIFDLPRNVRGKPMIEIGSKTGDSLQIFSLLFRPIYSIDLFAGKTSDQIRALFTQKTKGLEVTSLVGKSDDFVKSLVLPEKVALVYVDANHTEPYVRRDILNYWDRVMDGGFMCGHDYTPKMNETNGVKTAVDKIFGEPDKVYIDSSWVVHKIPGRKFNPKP